MKKLFLLLLSGMAMATAAKSSNKTKNPNVVFFVIDDVGWNDLSFHGSDQIQTPNIDMLAYSGVGLGRYYTHQSCTPSRAAMLSGKYGHKLGMQGFPLEQAEDRGLPVNVTLMPQYFKEAGYKTHLVGKWHVGHSRKEYLPTNRGFDSHFGFNGPYLDYYEYTKEIKYPNNVTETGFMLFRNMTPAWDVEGYITDVFTEEAKKVIKEHDKSSPLFLMVAHTAAHAADEGAALQAPPETVRDCNHIAYRERQLFAAMMKKLDDSIGEIVKYLHKLKMMENTIIVVVTDNGAMSAGGTAVMENYGSNYPLRGTKGSPYEGAVRASGLVWAPSLNNSENYWDGYMHVSDWVPTLLGAAGLKVPTNIDGQNQWHNINSNKPSNRTPIYEINDYNAHGTITVGDFKLLTGTIRPLFSGHYGSDFQTNIRDPPSYAKALSNSEVYKVMDKLGKTYQESIREKLTITCDDTKTKTCTPKKGSVCLYNIQEDPCEYVDIADKYPDLVKEMLALLETETTKIIPRLVVPYYSDPLAAASLHNFTWVPWIES